MKKLLITLMSAFLLMACGSDSSAKDVEASVEKNLVGLDAIVSVMNGDHVEEADTATVTKLLGLSEDKVVEAIGYFDNDNSAKQFILVQAKDADATYDVVDALNYYLENLTDSATMYNPDQVELLKNGYIISGDEFAMLAVSEDTKEIQKAVAGFFK